jgi:hypothetical protein
MTAGNITDDKNQQYYSVVMAAREQPIKFIKGYKYAKVAHVLTC